MIRDRDDVPPRDAEKCEKEALLKNFCLPPGLSDYVGRSMLLIGTRGSGKTYYLRACRHKHKGVAFIGDLKFRLNSITQNIGGAGLSFKYIPPSLELPIRSKTATLLSAWLAEETVKRGISPPLDLLKKMIPIPINMNKINITGNIFSEISEINLNQFSSINNNSLFIRYVTEISKRCETSEGGLLILLDRAEDVPYPCLTPIFMLLDQGHPFFTIVAARPGIIGPQSLLSPLLMHPGDQYDIVHLGASPYSIKWRKYALSVLKAWIPNSVEQCPTEMLNLVLKLSRDSLRNAVILISNSIDEKEGSFSRTEFDEHLKILQNTLLKAAQGALRYINPDLKKLINKIRREVNPFILPVLIQTNNRKQGEFPLLSTSKDLSKDEIAIRLGLRAGFFTIQNDEHWHPYTILHEIEIPPIFLWREGDEWYDIQDIE